MRQSARFYRITGLVQGVGFRPCVYRVAIALNLKGEVFNDAQGVGVHLEGDSASLDAFEEELRRALPPLARIDTMTSAQAPYRGCETFTITASRGGPVKTAITPDAAVCQACLTDIFDSSNRRYRYAFTNCTHCGPRFTITRALPYDRAQTSMERFPMCPACQSEYEDPLDRRFHAQPNACPVCGPKLTLTDKLGRALPGDPIDEAVALLRAGSILAIKGLGGFHLACDARNPEAVRRLRERKHRDEKPFAVMFANSASAALAAEMDANDKRLLEGTEHPILLLTKKLGYSAFSEVAPGLSEIGVMLPYTPLHWLLFHTLAGKPSGSSWCEDLVLDDALVMTSANPSGEPLVIDNAESYERLGAIADAFLLHNRDILIGCDDSVVRRLDDSPVFVRRARGYTPRSVKLSLAIGPGLATGPYLKNTACVSRGSEAFLTQHIGELANRASHMALEDAIAHLESILEVRPEFVSCDAHPDFFSSHLARRIAESRSLPLYPIYHHAAHIGVVMAETGRTEPTLGLALDGVGLGPASGIWGGEMLLVDATGFRRESHLTELALVGADKAAREPWRMGAALLLALGLEDRIDQRYADHPYAEHYAQVAANPRLTKRTSALGRYFDGLASLLGLCDIQHDEAHAAMLLESLASTREGRVLTGWKCTAGEINLLGIFPQLLSQQDKAQAAADFHRTLARALSEALSQCAERLHYTGPIAITGGCAVNRLLAHTLRIDLESLGLQPRWPQEVPPGDGGLALGELWLAALCREAGVLEHTFRTNPSCV